MGYQSFHYMFFKYAQNNLEYLIKNMAHLVIQIYHSMLELIFQIRCYYISFLCLSVINVKV